jgi:hypothetical protein
MSTNPDLLHVSPDMSKSTCLFNITSLLFRKQEPGKAFNTMPIFWFLS